ncbi:hypothetical protein, conserved [Trypanosoma brucei gambiense DAL972]|uniref:T. brucei spp.-specific protein n=1 Tax=Trypanosoma brucei gambiense (strain MHOM/CI/86/DAL972) TaxID=679716 RepID=D0A2W3_TRYB9|nr:hypothetical protein, conserved [Trypanosoma brucei gambiense DAL972]CBH15607.1 hypothetical protein, conserved [Trypanosoma brucei gambiense DAL972]|eukprot:XP_011777871.1 hypothetical protein, conserved [Trypanosoma brucei gambiense DAL972]
MDKQEMLILLFSLLFLRNPAEAFESRSYVKPDGDPDCTNLTGVSHVPYHYGMAHYAEENCTKVNAKRETSHNKEQTGNCTLCVGYHICYSLYKCVSKDFVRFFGNGSQEEPASEEKKDNESALDAADTSSSGTGTESPEESTNDTTNVRSNVEDVKDGKENVTSPEEESRGAPHGTAVPPLEERSPNPTDRNNLTRNHILTLFAGKFSSNSQLVLNLNNKIMLSTLFFLL